MIPVKRNRPFFKFMNTDSSNNWPQVAQRSPLPQQEKKGEVSTPNSLLQSIPLPNTPLHRLPARDPLDPLLQVREVFHLLLGEAGLLPTFDPRPGLDVRNTVLALAAASEVFAFFAGVLARELDFEHAVGAQGFLLEALDGVGDFLGGGAREVVYLAW